MSDFRLPSLGADMDEGKVVEWLVKPGDQVKKGDLVVVVETSKAGVEVEIWEEGVIERLLVEPGTVVPVGTVLATLAPVGASPSPETTGAAPAEPSRNVGAGFTPARPTPTPIPTPTPSPVAVAPAGRPVSPRARRLAAELGVDLARVSGTGPGGSVVGEDVVRASVAPTGERLRASPHARRRARALGVDLNRVRGTGPHGSITGPDVEAAARPAPLPERVSDDPALAMRRTIAAAMSRAKREIPHYYLAHRVSLQAALAWLEATNAERPIAERLLPAALFVKAIANAVAKVPEVNGFYEQDTFHPAEHVHLGVAVALRQGGLIAPALREVDAKPLETVMQELRDLVARTRQGKLRASELSSATLTFSNVGERGVDAVYGVIHPPQVALVGAGRVRPEPWVEDEQVVVHPVLDLTLSADHRVSDGARGARFLAEIDRLLQTPEAL